MGCWNQTCGLSQLHIRHGQDVMVVALVKNNGYDSLCYTTPFWAPVMVIRAGSGPKPRHSMVDALPDPVNWPSRWS